MSLYNNILETIGKTPLVRLNKFESQFKLNNEIYGKLESFNPSNNVKIRPAYQMIKALYDKKLMNTDSIIVEATSGNTGIGLAVIGAYYGNKVIIIMPDKVSQERIDVIRHYGAEIILTDATLGITGSKDKAIELAMNPLVVIPSQFENSENPNSHYLTTAIELDSDLKNIDYIFIGVGTGGTISGVGRYFKELNNTTKIIAVEPFESQVLRGLSPNSHSIAGISPGFIPLNYNKDYVDDIVAVKSDDAWKMTKSFVKLEAISIGISSGATLSAVIEYIKMHNLKNKRIICILPDSGEKYFSTGVFY